LIAFYATTLLLALLWAAESWVSGTGFRGNWLQLPLLCLGIYALVQSLALGRSSDASIDGIGFTISVDPFESRVAAIHIFVLSIFFAATLFYIDSAKRLRRLAILIVVFGFAYAFYSILQLVLSPEAIFGIYRPTATPFGSFVNRNDFAAFMVMLASIPLGMLFSGAIAREKRLIYVVAVGLMATSLLLSRSRGGLVALLVEFPLLVILTARGRGKSKILLKAGLSLAFLITAIGGTLLVGGETSLTRLSVTNFATEKPAETTSRFHMWSVTTSIIRDRWILGAGIGAFPTVYPRYDTSSGTERVEQAHNDYLQLLADAGLVGAAIGLFFLYSLIRQARKSIRVNNLFRRGVAVGALAGIVAILVQSLFDFVLHITAISVMFLTLLAMLVASGRDFEDDIPGDDEPRRRRQSASVSSLRHRDSARRSDA
jgi:O-antigen ligase